jgi:mRNA interferase MazF
MREGDVVIAAVPQIDEQVKKRPVLLLREMPPYRDLLVCGITTQLQHRVPDFDDVISPQDADFRSSGLVARSLIGVAPEERSKPQEQLCHEW